MADPVQGFGERLSRERRRLGLNQSQVATASGVSLQTQVAYEGDSRSPAVSYLLGLEPLGFDVTFLLYGLSKKAFAAEGLDPDLLGRLLELVDDWCRAHDAEIPVGKKGAVLTLLYRQALQPRGLQPDHIQTVFKSVA